MSLEGDVEALREALARHAFDGGEVPCPDCPPVGCAGVEGRYQWERCEGLDIWLSTADLPARIAALEQENERLKVHNMALLCAYKTNELAEAVCERAQPGCAYKWATDRCSECPDNKLCELLHSWREGRK